MIHYESVIVVVAGAMGLSAGLGLMGGLLGGMICQNSSTFFKWGAVAGAVLGTGVGVHATIYGGMSFGLWVLLVVYVHAIPFLWLWLVRFGAQSFMRNLRPGEKERLRSALQSSVTGFDGYGLIKQGVMRTLDRQTILLTNDDTITFDMASSRGKLIVHGRVLANRTDAEIASLLVREFTHLSNSGDNAGASSVDILRGGKWTARMQADAFAVEIYFEETCLVTRGFGRDELLCESTCLPYAHRPTRQQILELVENPDHMAARLGAVLGEQLTWA